MAQIPTGLPDLHSVYCHSDVSVYTHAHTKTHTHAVHFSWYLSGRLHGRVAVYRKEGILFYVYVPFLYEDVSIRYVVCAVAVRL
jgi:hypothetical protein